MSERVRVLRVTRERERVVGPLRKVLGSAAAVGGPVSLGYAVRARGEQDRGCGRTGKRDDKQRHGPETHKNPLDPKSSQLSQLLFHSASRHSSQSRHNKGSVPLARLTELCVRALSSNTARCMPLIRGVIAERYRRQNALRLLRPRAQKTPRSCPQSQSANAETSHRLTQAETNLLTPEH
jgi:hypothetical protein